MIAIAGGGIGGLTAALTLGADLVLERSARIDDGFGIQLSPDAVAVLHGLGVALDGVAVRPAAREIRRWADGALIVRQPLPAGHLALRRADLVRTLRGALRPGVLQFAEVRSAAELAHRAELVVGADGLHSVVRAAVVGDAVRPLGWTAHRGLAEGATMEPVVRVWLGPGAHVVAYPVPGAVNVVAVGDGTFDGWCEEVRLLVTAADRRHELFDRPAAATWRRGRLVLLGDAAHPMAPFLAQGAAQAILDAAALTAGPADYEARRRPVAERIAAASAAAGPTFHLPDGPAQRRRDAQLSLDAQLRVS